MKWVETFQEWSETEEITGMTRKNKRKKNTDCNSFVYSHSYSKHSLYKKQYKKQDENSIEISF